MKTLLAASIALMLTGASFAQTNNSGSTGGSGNDGNPNYLTGPNIQRFYQDDTMTTMKSAAEMKAEMDAMTDEERASLATACESNQDPKFEELCLSMRTN